MQSEDIENLRNALKGALNEIAKPMETVEFSRENYNKLFPYSRIETPIESVKLGEHQFEKLDAKTRQSILKAVHDTLGNPDIVINEERQSVFGDMNTAHLYAKSFEINGKNKAVQSVVVAIENENVSISSHERDINNIVNKIKMPEQLIYVSDEIGQVIERVTGKQLVTVNPTRVNNSVPPQVSIAQSFKKSSSQSESEILSQPMTVTVNDKERVCHNGVLEGFKNAVKMIDDLQQENRLLKNENAELHKQLEARQNQSHKKSCSDIWER